MCKFYDIPITNGVDSGPLWNPYSHEWFAELTDLPIAEGKKLLLVPKAIVRKRLDYTSEEYFNNYVISYLRGAELDANTELVRTLKDGRKEVYKIDLEKKYGSGKAANTEQTLLHPELLDQYRQVKAERPARPLGHDELDEAEELGRPDWSALLQAVLDVPAGPTGATAYHRGIKDLLSVLFYPSLMYPRLENPLHGGRKRVDMNYTNMATTGFFAYLARHPRYPCAYVLVECKNYNGDPANPELDQLSGRFSRNRGVIGLLVCRAISDRELFTERCKDTAQDDRGFIIALDDGDLRTLVDAASAPNPTEAQFLFLRERFEKLVM